MNNLSLTFSWTASWDYSERMTDLSYTHLNYMTTCMTFPKFSPYLGGRSVGNLTLSFASPSSICAGWGWGCGWLGPPLFSIFANAQAEAGDRGQPLHMTILPILRPTLNVPRNFSSLTLVLTHTYSQIVGSFWGEGPLPPPHSFFLFPVFTFYSPLIFSYDACVKRTTKPF